MGVNETALSLLNSAQNQAVRQRNDRQMKVDICAIERNEAKAAHDHALTVIERCEFDVGRTRRTHTDYAKYLRESPEQTNSALQATLADLSRKVENALARLEVAKSQAADKKEILDEAERLLSFQTAQLNKAIEDHRGVLREMERLNQST